MGYVGCSTYICTCVLLACDFDQEPVHALSLLCVPLCILGCAFLTFVHRESAEKAMDQLHGKRVLPGVSVWCATYMHVFGTNGKEALLLCVFDQTDCVQLPVISVPLLFLWTLSSIHHDL